MAKIKALGKAGFPVSTWTKKVGAVVTTYWLFREPRKLSFMKETRVNMAERTLLYAALEIVISIQKGSHHRFRLDNVSFIPP